MCQKMSTTVANLKKKSVSRKAHTAAVPSEEPSSATTAEVLRTVVRRPLITQRTSALIRRHGITLWLRSLPVVPRPRHHLKEGVTR